MDISPFFLQVEEQPIFATVSFVEFLLQAICQISTEQDSIKTQPQTLTLTGENMRKGKQVVGFRRGKLVAVLNTPNVKIGEKLVTSTSDGRSRVTTQNARLEELKRKQWKQAEARRIVNARNTATNQGQ